MDRHVCFDKDLYGEERKIDVMIWYRNVTTDLLRISKVDNGKSNNCNGVALHIAFLTWNRLEKTCSGDVGRRDET